MRSSKSQFILLETDDYDQDIIDAMPDEYQNSILNSSVSFSILESSVTFRNIKIFGKHANCSELDMIFDYNLIFANTNLIIDHSSMEELSDIMTFQVLNLEQSHTI